METLNGCDEGESNDGDAARRASFWRQWRKLLPQASSLSHPIALPEELSHQLQHEELAAAGRAQVAFSASCSASSVEGSPTCCVLRLCQAHRADVLLGECPCSAPSSDQSSCPESHWAMAMCSSRPFRMPAVAGHAEQVCLEMLHAPLAWVVWHKVRSVIPNPMATNYSQPSEDGDTLKLGAFVPCIDMANHASTPNCEVCVGVAQALKRSFWEQTCESFD